MIFFFSLKRELVKSPHLSEQICQEIKLIERADDLSRIRRNVDNMFVKDNSGTKLRRIRRQTDIVTNGKSHLNKYLG